MGIMNKKNNVINKKKYYTDCERIVLSSIILDSNKYDNIFKGLVQSDFHNRDNLRIFAAMTNIKSDNKFIDLILLLKYLSKDNIKSAVDKNFFNKIIKKYKENSHDVKQYMEILKEESLRRYIVNMTKRMFAKYSSNYHSPNSIINKVNEIMSKKNQCITVEETLKPYSFSYHLDQYRIHIEHLMGLYQKTGMTGLASGFHELDNYTSGLQDNHLIIIAGKPSVGKTTFAMNILQHTAIKNCKTVFFFSLEMEINELLHKLVSPMYNIGTKILQQGRLSKDGNAKLWKSVDTVRYKNVFFDHKYTLTIDDIRKKINFIKSKEKKKPNLILVDYLQLMQTKKQTNNNNLKVSEVTRGLKILASEYNIPIIALSQLNRSYKIREDKRPQLSDLRDSGAIEQDADIVIFVDRDSSDKKGCIHILKNRHGRLGEFKLSFLF